jgi:uncharacterized damage-inducible protein DinB
MRPMTSARLSLFAGAVFATLVVSPQVVRAQSLMNDMHAEVSAVQKKIIDLANAMPETSYAWRPTAGVRSTGEVFKHIAADNYLIPIAMGAPAPASSGISATDMSTVQKYETRSATRAEIIAELEASFRHLHGAMRLTTDTNLGEGIKFFGQDMTRQKVMIVTLSHLHEHLGQLIAYARSNKVVPPWSK